MSSAIQTRNLTKWFPPPNALTGWLRAGARSQGTLAVEGVTLDVRGGEIFGLVGPNGAGKTSLVKLLATLILPTSGTAQVCGQPLSNERAIKANIGLVTCNERSFFPRLSCRENLHFYAGLQNLSATQSQQRIADLVDLLDMREFLDKRFDRCSLGMKHRLALARGLLHNPRLLFLDEPTRSLDPLAASRFREALYALAHQEGRTILLVTHDLNEAVDLCDRVAVMVGGQLRVAGDPERLREQCRASSLCQLTLSGYTPVLTQRLTQLGDIEVVREQSLDADLAQVELRLHDRRHALPALIRTVEENRSRVEALTFASASWDDIFTQLEPEGEPPAPEPVEPSASPGRLPLPETDPPKSPMASAVRKAGLFLRRDFKTQTSYKLAFVLQMLGIVLSSASFYFIAQLFGAQANPALERYGGDYFAFVLIGVAFTGYQSVALHAFASTIQSAQVIGSLEAMLVTPTSLATLLLGSSLWNFIETTVRTTFYLLVGALLFGADLGSANVPGGFVVLLLSVLTFSGIGILSACFVIVFKRGNPINFLIGSLSVLLGGVYYPVEVLPGVLQTLSRIYPLTYALQAMRRALLQGASLPELLPEMGALLVFTALLLPLSLVAFRYAVRQAKREGSLMQF